MTALSTAYGITHIDLVIANAGIFEHLAPVSEWDVGQVQRMIDVNVYGLVRLFQAVMPHLRLANEPKLAYVSSQLGSIALSAKEALWPGAYGLSKAAGNYVIAKISAESEWLSAFCLDPGYVAKCIVQACVVCRTILNKYCSQVQTDMGNGAANMMGLEKAPVTLEQSISGMVRNVSNYSIFLTRRSTNNHRSRTHERQSAVGRFALLRRR